MIRVGIVGVGNIASMFVQSVEFYRRSGGEPRGLIHTNVGGYSVGDIKVVYAVDVSKHKVGRDLKEAIFAKPNQVPKLVELPETGVVVRMGRVLDGVAEHMVEEFPPSSAPQPELEELVDEVRSYSIDVLANLLPVGSREASRFYAEVAAKSGAAFVNCVPEFIASDPQYSSLFEKHGALVLGDDIKGQIGATAVHRALASLVTTRGGEIVESYQLNVGGNTDFKNMLDLGRLDSKKVSKTMAVAATQPNPDTVLDRIFAGPSGYIPFLGNTKVSYIYMKVSGFMGLPVVIDLKLTVDDKAMASAVLVDVVRLAKALKDRGIYGSPGWASSFYFKHPPAPTRSDEEALAVLYRELEKLKIPIEPKRLPNWVFNTA
ncbi:MAG: inositol-3-phosphate synthase [Sulfolobales archaeon]|nr:inositol-3-phosphate synthase [Sulfolobales archaeon]MCX8208609.1 inositol-3-phosphate synthase [Sulfolobales archaeon]MDW8010504.1 inositol-3-phosphate synthase [Sulfolobales archaeon]